MKISVVICAYNEEKTIAKCIEAVKNQTFPGNDYEIVVVNNNSTDKTEEVARSYGARVVFEKQKGIAHARQAGCKSAKGDIIVYTDADTHVPKNWLQRIADAYAKDKDLIAYGGTYRITTGSHFARFVINHTMYPLYLFAKIITGGWLLIGPNMSFKKWAFDKSGGFNTAISQGEDTDISQKLQKIGKVKLVNNFFVYQTGRRFEKGLISGLKSYGINWPMKVFFHKDTSQTLKDFR